MLIRESSQQHLTGYSWPFWDVGALAGRVLHGSWYVVVNATHMPSQISSSLRVKRVCLASIPCRTRRPTPHTRPPAPRPSR